MSVTILKLWMLAALLFVAGCCCCGSGGDISTTDDAWVATGDGSAEVADATEPPVVVGPDEITPPTGEPVAGSELNKFFPDSTDELLLIYKQEKEGFAQANLSRDAVEVATLSISDTRSNPEAVDKYKESTDMIAGHPVAAMGSKATGVLVGGRFQISVRSLDDSFTEADRRAWLEKFDLAGLSQLK